jgi:hypothetical protein
LKKRLIRAGLLVNCCSVCGLRPEWQGQLLVMILDHINGDRSDNRIENLRLLCPNCNSQQPTFAGKNWGRYSALLGGNPQDKGQPAPRQVGGRRKKMPAAPVEVPVASRASLNERARCGPSQLEPASPQGVGDRVVKGGSDCLRPGPGGRDEQTPEARGTVGSVLT